MYANWVKILRNFVEWIYLLVIVSSSYSFGYFVISLSISILMPHHSSINYYQLSPEQTIQSLHTTFTGLSQADIVTRRKLYGNNILIQTVQDSLIVKFLKQFKDAILMILISNAVLAYRINDHRTALVLAVIVLINACIGFFQEYKAEKTMTHLKMMVKSQTTVIRDGKHHMVPSSELVPGDIVIIEEGMTVPADLRILQENALSSNDFALTGESNPVRKYIHAISEDVVSAERNNLLYMGTTIATGNGMGVVIYTGMQTLIWHIAHLSQDTDVEISPLQKEIRHLSKILTLSTLAIWCILILIAMMVDMWWYQALLFALGIASALMPQWLPSQINIALSNASYRLAQHHVIIKKLSAVETMGAVNMICTDKTGTLTQNQMTVISCTIGSQSYQVTGVWYQNDGEFVPQLQAIWRFWEKSQTLSVQDLFFMTAIMASNAHIHEADANHLRSYCLWDPTEGAVITLASKAGYNIDILNTQYPELYEFPFDSNRKMMSSIRCIDGLYYVFVKGAVDQILNKSSQSAMTWSIQNLTAQDRTKILGHIDQLAQQALRNIGFAYRIIDAQIYQSIVQRHNPESYHEVEQELVYLWFVSMQDPPRPEVKSAMQYTHDAHIQVNMVTGDYGVTAQAIAQKVTMIWPEQTCQIITWQELTQKRDIDIIHGIQKWPVIFCRVSPEDKLRIVGLLKKAGYIVAVTGDGVNDAPALKKADIGVAMGITGTDVAKDSAEMVLMDDNFASLVQAIREWRMIFTNISKTIIWCLTTNFGELFVSIISLIWMSLWWRPLAITPLLILCIDLIGEMFPLSALTFDPADRDIDTRKPRNIYAHVLNTATIIDLVISGLVMAVLGYSAFVWMYRYHWVNLNQWSQHNLYAHAITLTYVTMMMCQFVNIMVIRTGRQHSIFTSYLRSNSKLLIALTISMFCILNIVYNPAIQKYLGTGSLTAIDRSVAVLGSLLYLWYRETHRKWRIWHRSLQH